MWSWISSTWTYLLHSWQRWLIATICLGLVAIHLAFPTIPVDWITVVLIAIAALALISPKREDAVALAMKALPYIKKARVAGIEVELSEEIKKLALAVDTAKASLADQSKLVLAPEFQTDQADILQALKSDPRAALLLLAAKIEQQVMLRLAKHGIRRQGEAMSARRAIEIGIRHGVFPKEIMAPFDDFWSIRNQVAHGHAFDVDESVVLSLVSLGLDVLKLVSVQGDNGSGSSN